ncbi:disulfide bond formation protein B [Halopenitus sp. H-Gu1]|uniref:disulfide bond formation protein B n=1 Tax=Halopenitus sp. H-Gu1 TaxID=3242697 RepID=UPI00359D725C
MRDRTVLAVCTLTATIAMGGSLYFSEVLGLVPCVLCWYQRLLMYPLVVILGIATYEDRSGVWRTALPFSGLGIVVSAYHVSLQVTSGLTCGVDGSCAAVLWRGFGVFTIPRLALVGFVMISLGLCALALAERGIVDPLSLARPDRH